MRVPAGGRSPGRYLPVRTPWARGDQTICEMPFAAHRGKTSRSGARWSNEYCGCEETNFTFGGESASEARIWSGDHSEKPMARALPARTTSESASIVSSSGVSGS
jgi:hypothetical protein